MSHAQKIESILIRPVRVIGKKLNWAIGLKVCGIPIAVLAISSASILSVLGCPQNIPRRGFEYLIALYNKFPAVPEYP